LGGGIVAERLPSDLGDEGSGSRRRLARAVGTQVRSRHRALPKSAGDLECRLGSKRPVVVLEDAFGVATGVFVLAVLHGPEEGGEGGEGQQQGEGRQEQDDGHRRPPAAAIRRALSITTSEEPDMAMAAMKGLIRPRIAAGAATRL